MRERTTAVRELTSDEALDYLLRNSPYFRARAKEGQLMLVGTGRAVFNTVCEFSDERRRRRFLERFDGARRQPLARLELNECWLLCPHGSLVP